MNISCEDYGFNILSIVNTYINVNLLNDCRNRFFFLSTTGMVCTGTYYPIVPIVIIYICTGTYYPIVPIVIIYICTGTYYPIVPIVIIYICTGTYYPIVPIVIIYICPIVPIVIIYICPIVPIVIIYIYPIVPIVIIYICTAWALDRILFGWTYNLIFWGQLDDYDCNVFSYIF